MRQAVRASAGTRGIYLCHALAVGLAIYFWGPLIDAKWGLTDDHEIVHFIGRHERLPAADIIATLKQTEINSASTQARFRPGYYTLRALESAAWGKNPALWYTFRIGIAVLLGITLAHFCTAFAGPVLTAGFLVFALSQPYWRDIFARAGPAETYAVLGLCLMALGWGAASRSYIGIGRVFCIGLGILIAAGSKENFLIAGALPLWLLFTRRVSISLASRLLCAGVLGYLFWIASTVLNRLLQNGADIYANDISVAYRLKLAGGFMSQPVVIIWICAIATLLAVGFRGRRRPAPGGADPAKVVFTATHRGYPLALGTLLLVYAAQFVFYAGKWPDGADARYLFPGMLAAHLALLVGASAAIRFLGFAPGLRQWRTPCELLLALAFVIPVCDGIVTNRIGAIETVRFTRELERKFGIVTRELRGLPGTVVVINSHDLWDYERAVAVARFLKAEGLDNPVAVRLNGYSSADRLPGSFEKRVAQLMEQLARGDHGGTTVPFGEAVLTDCYSIGLSGPALVTCRGGTQLWPN